MNTVSLHEAQANLPELIDHLAPAEELAITRDDKFVAKIVGPAAEKGRPVLGRGKGKRTIISEDDDHLKDFEEYMP